MCSFGTCIKIPGPKKKKIAYIGDIILVSVQWISPRNLLY